MARKKRLLSKTVTARFRAWLDPIGTTEAARRLGVSPRTIRRWKQTGKVPTAQWSRVAKLKPTKRRKSGLRKSDIPKRRKKREKYQTDRHEGIRVSFPFSRKLPLRDIEATWKAIMSRWSNLVSETGLGFGHIKLNIVSNGAWYPMELSSGHQGPGEGGLQTQYVSTRVTTTEGETQAIAVYEVLEVVSLEVGDAKVDARITELVITLWDPSKVGGRKPL